MDIDNGYRGSVTLWRSSGSGDDAAFVEAQFSAGLCGGAGTMPDGQHGALREHRGQIGSGSLIAALSSAP